MFKHHKNLQINWGTDITHWLSSKRGKFSITHREFRHFWVLWEKAEMRTAGSIVQTVQKGKCRQSVPQHSILGRWRVSQAVWTNVHYEVHLNRYTTESRFHEATEITCMGPVVTSAGIKGSWIPVSLRPAWSTKWVPGQPGLLQRETLFWKTRKKPPVHLRRATKGDIAFSLNPCPETGFLCSPGCPGTCFAWCDAAVFKEECLLPTEVLPAPGCSLSACGLLKVRHAHWRHSESLLIISHWSIDPSR